MRIGIVSTMASVPWGGSEELWAKMAQRALQTGIHVSICIPLRPRPDHEKLRALESAGADIFCIPDSLLHLRAHQLSRAINVLHRGLGEYLREHLSPLPRFLSTRPDVLLISDGGSIPAPAIIDSVRRRYAPRPYVIVSQANLGEVPNPTHRAKAAALYQDARFALFVSESNLRATERQLTRRLANARVIKNPVNLDRIDAVPWPDNKAVSFASVARLNTSAKGQDVLFEALSATRWRSRDWHLCLYGSGDDDAYLHELATFYALNDRIAFRGQSEDIRGIWRTHHALMLPSRVEGTPLAMVEAMLCGRPVIGTAVAGIPEWVREGRDGFLADAPAVTCLDAALERAWQERGRWQSIGSNAREDALRLYDPRPDETLLSIVMEAVNKSAGTFVLPREETKIASVDCVAREASPSVGIDHNSCV